MAEGDIEQEEHWYSTGSLFGVPKDRQIEIFENVKNKMEELNKTDMVEKYIAENYSDPGECYVAGFAFCYILIARRMQDTRAIRKAFWEFLLGTEPAIDPFAQPLPVQLIETVALGKDTTAGIRKSMEDYEKFQEKRKPKPEVA